MKKLIFLLLLSFVIIESQAQMAVTDAGATGLMAASNTTLTAIESVGKKVQKALETATWAKNLQSMKQLYTLVETTTCTHKKLGSLMRISGANNDCLMNFQYNIQTTQLSAALDMLSVVITNGMAMSADGRLRTINDAMANFKKSHTEMMKLTTSLQTVVDMRAVHQKEGSQLEAAYKSKIKF